MSTQEIKRCGQCNHYGPPVLWDHGTCQLTKEGKYDDERACSKWEKWNPGALKVSFKYPPGFEERVN